MKTFKSQLIRIAALAAVICLMCSCSTAQPEENEEPSAENAAAAESSEISMDEAVDTAHTDAGLEAYTAYADYEPENQEPVDMIPGSNGNVLVAYFSHATNTSIPDDQVDAATSASIMVSDDGAVTGNAQLIANWIAETTGGDLYAIQTTYTYPHDYDQLVAVGEGQDIDGILPEMLTSPANLEQYSYLYLVSPVWHYGMPAPVRAFLVDNDLAGKTILLFAVNSGSSFGSMTETLRELEPDANVVEGISVSQRDVPDARQEVINKVEELMTQIGEAPVRGDDGSLWIRIGDNAFQAVLADTQAAREFASMLENGPLSVEMRDYGGFEKVGSLGTSLTASNTEITTQPGDVVLYNGNQIVMFYGSNTWQYTPIAQVADIGEDWQNTLGSGPITAVFSLDE